MESRIVVIDGEGRPRQIGRGRVRGVALNDQPERLVAFDHGVVGDPHRHLLRGLAARKPQGLVQLTGIVAVVGVPFRLHGADVNRLRRKPSGPVYRECPRARTLVNRHRARR